MSNVPFKNRENLNLISDFVTYQSHKTGLLNSWS